MNLVATKIKVAQVPSVIFGQTLEDFDEQIEDILINLLYHLINNFHYLTTDKEELKEKSEQLDRYHRISKYIFNNYNNNITLQEIAKKEFLSPHYLSHEIKYATGHSFTDLINLTRIEESIKLLLDTTMSITEISEKITWKKDQKKGRTTYLDKSGKEIVLNQGKTWICMVQNEYSNDVKISK